MNALYLYFNTSLKLYSSERHYGQTNYVEWVVKAMRSILQLNHGVNMLHFEEMMSTLYLTNTFSWIFVVLTHWHNNPPQQSSTAILHNNPPQQSSTAILHNNPPQQSSTTILHNNRPQQSSTTIPHGNPPQQSSTGRHVARKKYSYS